MLTTARFTAHRYFSLELTQIVTALAFVTMSAAPAVAQVVIPSELEPTRPEQNLEQGPLIRSVPRQVTPLVRQEKAPENAEAITFAFREVKIEGATAIEPAVLRALWPAAPGEVVSVADLFRFANAITRAYAQSGYALSFAVVPEQNIENGVVAVRVVEGFVDEITFVGDRAEQLRGSPRLRRAEAVASKILHSRPLKTADLERYLLIINDMPGFEVTSTLDASPDTEGGAVLALEVTESKRIGAELSYNSYMPDSLGRHVAGAKVNYFGGPTGTEQVSLSTWRSLSSDAYWSVAGTASSAIGDDGLRAGLSGFHSQSDPETALLESLEYLGETTTASAFASYPLIRSRTENLILSTSFSFTDIRSEILDSPLTRDGVRALGFAATYDFADSTRAVTYLRAGYERGLDILDATGNSRANGRLDYNIATLDAQRTQPLFAAFSGEVSARVAFRGQTAFGPGGLFSNVECAFGGRRFGRGYDGGVLTGDHCALFYLELAWRGRVGPADTTVYGFGDGGYLWQKGTLEPGEIRRRSAASAGAGLRIGLTENMDGVVEASWAVDPPRGAADTDDFRVNAGLRVSF